MKKTVVIFVLLIVILAGVQSAHIGPIGATPPYMLIDYATCKDVSYVDSTIYPVNRTDEFSKMDSKIYAWFMIGYTLPTNATYTWDWYDPADKLYQQTFLNHSGNGPNTIAGQPLETERIPLEQKVGLWRVEVYIDEELLFQQKFTVGKYLVFVAVRGIPKALNASLTIDGEEQGIQGSTERMFQFDEGTSHILAFESIVNDAEGIRYVNATSAGPFTVEARGQIKLAYSAQYYLTVDSAYGNPQGAGWHDQGAVANFSVASPVYDYLATKHTVTSWTGDYIGTETSGTIEMDGPRIVEAVWENDYSLTYVIFAILVLAVIAVIIVKVRKKKEREIQAT